MSPQFVIGQVTNPIPVQGKAYFFKLQDRVEKEKALTLESPGVRQQVTDLLVNNRKQLLAASFQALAMNEAKIENLLAKRVVDNPNELSGARPAGAMAPANANANSNMSSNSNGASANGNTNAINANAGPGKANSTSNTSARSPNANR